MENTAVQRKENILMSGIILLGIVGRKEKLIFNTAHQKQWLQIFLQNLFREKCSLNSVRLLSLILLSPAVLVVVAIDVSTVVFPVIHPGSGEEEVANVSPSC